VVGGDKRLKFSQAVEKVLIVYQIVIPAKSVPAYLKDGTGIQKLLNLKEMNSR
jgi:hypothetical protein